MYKIIISDLQNKLVSDSVQFKTYSFNTDIKTFTDDFTAILIDVNFKILKGYNVQLFVNNLLVFFGIILKVTRQTSKTQSQVTISGKDRAFIISSSFCKKYTDYNNKTPKYMIDDLIKQCEVYVQPKGQIEESQDSSGFNSPDDIESHNQAVLNDLNESQVISLPQNKIVYDSEFLELGTIKHFKIDPGDKIYNKINEIVQQTGFDIFYRNDGSLFVGDLNKLRMSDKVKYSIIHQINGIDNNVIRATIDNDITNLYSTISVTSQSENSKYSDNFQHVNKEAVATNSEVPIKRYMGVNINSNVLSCEKYAIKIREDQRFDSFRALYEVEGHIDSNGVPWLINRNCRVYDSENEIYRELVIYNVVYLYSSNGPITRLTLSEEYRGELNI